MPGSQTTFVKLLKPQIEGDAEVWGEKLNEDMDKLETWLVETRKAQLQALYNGDPGLIDNLADPVVPQHLEDQQFRTAKLPLFYPNNLTLTAAQGHALVTRVMVEKMLDLLVPTGTIVAWSGDPNAIPAGWTLCYTADPAGQWINVNPTGTPGKQVFVPNLFGRFILGAYPSGQNPGWNHYNRNPGSITYGVADFQHTHNVSTPGYALIPQQIPGHTHKAGNGQDGFAVRVPTDTGSYWFGPNGSNNKLWTQGTVGPGAVGTNLAGGAADAHAHADATTTSQNSNVFGIPFYALCYLVRTADFYSGG